MSRDLQKNKEFNKSPFYYIHEGFLFLVYVSDESKSTMLNDSPADGEPPTSLRRKQWTVMMTKPWIELKTAKRTWKRMERRSVMASTADIQVSARRGRTTQELHSDALGGEKARETCRGANHRGEGVLEEVESVHR